MSGNNIGNEGAHYLAKALKTNTSLTTLDLSCNNIGDEGVRALAEALEKIKILSLSVLTVITQILKDQYKETGKLLNYFRKLRENNYAVDDLNLEEIERLPAVFALIREDIRNTAEAKQEEIKT